MSPPKKRDEIWQAKGRHVLLGHQLRATEKSMKELLGQ